MGGRRNKKMTPKKIQQWIAEGRGQGRGSAYKPWLTGLDASVDSFYCRIHSWEPGGRHYEALSRIEANYFKILSWHPDVVELREQFPLLPLEKTQEIAEKLGFEHPNYQGQPIVMTTDALISVQSNIGISQYARAVKPSEKLKDERVRQKLEIEFCYWEEVGDTPWGMVTELDIPQELSTNVSWIYHRYYLEDVSLPEREINRVAIVLTKWVTEKNASLSDLTADCDDQLCLLPGSSMSVVRYLIARHKWIVDMHQLIEPSKKLSLLSVNL